LSAGNGAPLTPPEWPGSDGVPGGAAVWPPVPGPPTPSAESHALGDDHALGDTHALREGDGAEHQSAASNKVPSEDLPGAAEAQHPVEAVESVADAEADAGDSGDFDVEEQDSAASSEVTSNDPPVATEQSPVESVADAEADSEVSGEFAATEVERPVESVADVDAGVSDDFDEGVEWPAVQPEPRSAAQQRRRVWMPAFLSRAHSRVHTGVFLPTKTESASSCFACSWKSRLEKKTQRCRSPLRVKKQLEGFPRTRIFWYLETFVWV
jgi:hypothetical protein